MARQSGKRGRAVNLEASLTAPVANGEEIENIVKADDIIVPAIVLPEIQICDAYIVGYKCKRITQPFIHQLNILPVNGEAIQV